MQKWNLCRCSPLHGQPGISFEDSLAVEATMLYFPSLARSRSVPDCRESARSLCISLLSLGRAILTYSSLRIFFAGGSISHPAAAVKEGYEIRYCNDKVLFSLD